VTSPEVARGYYQDVKSCDRIVKLLSYPRKEFGLLLNGKIKHFVAVWEGMDMELDRITRRLLILGIGIPWILMLASCNMPSLDLTDELATLEPTSTPSSVAVTETPLSTEIPSDTPVPPASPTHTIVHGPTMTPLAPPFAPQVQLSEESPWMVYRAGEGHSQSSTLFIVNSDGSGRRPLSTGITQEFEVEVKPDGDRFAYIIPASESADQIPHLVVRWIPSGGIETDLPLISEDVWETLSSQDELREQILKALNGPDAFEWSPHIGGHYLAFAAAIDNPKLDLYRFDTWSDNIRPLTSGPNHRYQPFWSPDGQWVLHLEVQDFNDGGGWTVEAVSAVSFDGSDSKELYEPHGNRHQLIKWLNDTTFLVTEIRNSQPWSIMRAKTSGSSPEVLYDDFVPGIDETSFDDLQTVVAFCLAQGQDPPGVYFHFLAEEETDLVLPGPCRSVVWWQGKGVFIANGEQGTVFIRRTGEVVKEMDEMLDPVSLSPDGQWMVAYGEEGATVYTHIGVLIRKITDGAVEQVIWRPDSSGFFLDMYPKANPNNSHHLYTYDLDDWELQLVDLDFRGGHFWAILIVEE
jgi:hypothetical protein